MTRHRTLRTWQETILLSGAAFLFYLPFVAREPYPGDPAELATACFALGIPHPPGYPVYVWIGRLFCLVPVNPAFAINLMSAFWTAVAVGFIYAVLRELSASRTASLAGSLLYALCPCVWGLAVVAEVYPLNSAFLSAVLLASLRWWHTKDRKWFWITSLLFGLSLGVHMLNVFLLPGLFFLAIGDRRTRQPFRLADWLVGASLFAVAGSQFLWLFWRAHHQPAYQWGPIESWRNWLDFVSAKEFRAYAFAYPLVQIPKRFAIVALRLFENVSIFIPFGVAGLWNLAKRQKVFAILTTSFYVLEVSFLAQYGVEDVDQFFYASYLVFALWTGIGLDAFLNMVKSRWPQKGLVSAHALTVVAILLLIVVCACFTYTIYPTVNLNSDAVAFSDQFCRFALQTVEEQAVIHTNWGLYTVFKFLQVTDRQRPDVTLSHWGDSSTIEREFERHVGRPFYTTEIGERRSQKLEFKPTVVQGLFKVRRSGA